MTHDFPEWNDPSSTSDLISYKMVLEVSGFSQDDMEDILKNIEMQDEVSELKKMADLEMAA